MNDTIRPAAAFAKEWLAKWDANELVTSIEMGGLGPGYEQGIQIVAAEMLRHVLDVGYDESCWDDADNAAWTADRAAMEKAFYASDVIEKIGPSGAMFGAAWNLALCIYRRGDDALNDVAVKDRRIFVRKEFPSIGAATA